MEDNKGGCLQDPFQSNVKSLHDIHPSEDALQKQMNHYPSLPGDDFMGTDTEGLYKVQTINQPQEKKVQIFTKTIWRNLLKFRAAIFRQMKLRSTCARIMAKRKYGDSLWSTAHHFFCKTLWRQLDGMGRHGFQWLWLTGYWWYDMQQKLVDEIWRIYFLLRQGKFDWFHATVQINNDPKHNMTGSFFF